MVEHQPEEIVAYMAQSCRLRQAVHLTDDQLATVKGYLEKLKPNILKFAGQATDSVNSMISGEAWLVTGNIGNEDRVKDGGGPGDQGLRSQGRDRRLAGRRDDRQGRCQREADQAVLEKSEQAENIAENFHAYGRPLFNEKAYKLLVDQGKKDQADRYHYNNAEEVLGQDRSSRAPGPRPRSRSSSSTRSSEPDQRRCPREASAGSCGPADVELRAAQRRGCDAWRRSCRPASSWSACSSCRSP